MLLLADSFTERGDSVDLMSMSNALQDYLSIETTIAFGSGDSRTSNKRVAEARSLGLEVVEFSTKKDLEVLARSKNVTHTYVFSDGKPTSMLYNRSDPGDFRILDTVHITRVVFRNFHPHGDHYLYVSEWLNKWARKKHGRKIEAMAHPQVSWLPHIVEPIEGDGDFFRRKVGLPKHSNVIGRIGGSDQFSDPAARAGVFALLEKHKDLFVVCANTKPFGSHERLIYTPPLSRASVWDFYAACSALINGRLMGESFGFSVAEPLSLGKPVIAPNWTRNPLMDRNHVDLLEGTNLLYNSKLDFVQKVEAALSDPLPKEDLRSRTADFRASKVAARFVDLVLTGYKESNSRESPRLSMD